MGHPTPRLTTNVFAVSPATGRLEGPWPYGNRPGIFAGPARQGQQGSASFPSQGSFTPLFRYAFDGGTNGAAFGTVSLPKGAQIQTSFAGGYGGAYDTTIVRPGRTSSLRLSIKAGSDGDPGGDGTGVGMGLFGANYSLPSDCACSDGDYLFSWVRIRKPAGFNCRTSVGTLKFLRHYTSSPVAYGHIDTWIGMPGYVPQEDSTYNLAHGTQSGWAMGNESNHGGEVWRSGYGQQSGIATNSSRILSSDAWDTFEVMHRFSSDGNLASRIIWLNDLLVLNWTGTTMYFIDASGALQTFTGMTPNPLSASGVIMDKMRLFTYFNDNAPQDEYVNVDETVYHRIASGGSFAALPAVDAYGNRHLGVNV